MEIQNDETANLSAEMAPTYDENIVNQQLAKLKLEQNPVMATVMGLVTAVLCAAIWALITGITNMQIGWMAVGVGVAVGIAVRHFGKGLDPIYGIIGASLALVGCLLGNFLTVLFLSTAAEEISVLAILPLLSFPTIVSVMVDTFQPMDVLFYGIAIYEGYKFSFRQLTEEHFALATEQTPA